MNRNLLFESITKMITVTINDIADFVRTKCITEQVKLSQNFSCEKCGCIMVQYGNFAGFNFFQCGVREWWSGESMPAELEPGLTFTRLMFLGDDGINVCVNYGMIRQNLRDHFGIDI